MTLSPRQTVPKKYPRAGGGLSPCKQSPRIMIYYAPTAKAIRQSRTSTAEAFPLPPFCYALPVLLFLPFCIARTGRKNNRIQSKQKTKTRETREQARRETRKANAYIYKAKQTYKDHQNKQSKERKARQREKQERSPEKHINRQAREKRKAILFPSMPIYRIAIYYNKAI